ncbi:MAG: hypothetical protein JO352_12660 [Chloroflexi bacterium]|nr:hypothetical protein [Chloroflexota bacterium]MBV9597069.1 hypothetical protein [Chloroflexota bacterium]
MRRALALGLVSIPLALAACGPSTTPATPAPVASTTTPAPGASPVVSPESAAVVDAAVTDAASHLGVSRDTLHVDQVEPRQWPDSSLGCPQPGQLYSQIVTPGFLIVISSGAHQLEYHSDDRTRVTLCTET